MVTEKQNMLILLLPLYLLYICWTTVWFYTFQAVVKEMLEQLVRVCITFIRIALILTLVQAGCSDRVETTWPIGLVSFQLVNVRYREVKVTTFQLFKRLASQLNYTIIAFLWKLYLKKQ